MKIQTENETGAVRLYPVSQPRPSPGWTVREPSEADRALIDSGVPLRWQPDDPEVPSGPGQLVEAAAPPAHVPQTVTPRQFRLALNELGLRQQVEDAVAAGTQDLKDEWEYATEIRRDHQSTHDLVAALGMTSEEADDVFRRAPRQSRT